MKLFTFSILNTPKKRKPYHQKNLREQLLVACEIALVEMPIETVSLREIARRAGVSHAAPQHHFESLGHLFSEVAVRGFERFVRDIQLGAERGAKCGSEDRLTNMGCAYVEFAKRNVAVYGLMFGKREAMVVTAGLKSAMRKAWRQLEEAAGEIVDAQHATLAAAAIWSAMHGFATLRHSRRLPMTAAVASEREMMRALIAGLKANHPNQVKYGVSSNRDRVFTRE
jgi:AcrR family transcriptional regulator